MLTTNEFLTNPRILRDVQVLVVDNDRDSGELYSALFESYGAKVTALGSIKEALNLLHGYMPAVLICEMSFLGESVYPLIQQIRNLALSSGRTIPILVTSTYSPTSFQQLKVKVEAYLLKPIDIDHLVDQVWDLTLLSNTDPLSIQDWVIKQNFDETMYCDVFVE